MHNNLSLQLKTTQQLLLSLSMQKALFVLQLPVLELREWLEEELSLNPVLERKERNEDDTSECSYEEDYNTDSYSPKEASSSDSYEPQETASHCVEHSPSLFEYLMDQARLVFGKKELLIAEQIIGNLNEKGFLPSIPEDLLLFYSVEEIESVIGEIKRLDPVGICASSVQECLLLQMRAACKTDSLSYWVIENHFEDFLQQRFRFLEKKCHLSSEQIQTTLKDELSLLDPYPGLRFQHTVTQTIVPDVTLEKIEDKWKIHINDTPLPRFEVSKEYESIYSELGSSDKKYFSKQYNAAKWIIRSVKKRNETILSIVKYIVNKQHAFFKCDKNQISPLSMGEVAEALSLNESTIARAVSHKYLACPQGVFPLKQFFSISLSKTSSDVSTYSAKQMLQKIIHEENKKEPLSDTALVKKMQRMGFTCARRTVTKYRKALQIAPASKRKLQ